jgi:hypothetical protein
MGIFSKKVDSSQFLWSTFMTISQAIKVGEDVGMYQEEGVNSSEFWALYLWALAPFESKPNELSPYALSALKNINTTFESKAEAQKFVFTKRTEDYELVAMSVLDINLELVDKFLNLRVMHNEMFTQDCINSMTAGYQKHFSKTYTKETSVLIYLLTLALRSILMDTMKVRTAEKIERRKSGFFWVSLMLVDWHFKAQVN